jgi:hypothetical protein
MPEPAPENQFQPPPPTTQDQGRPGGDPPVLLPAPPGTPAEDIPLALPAAEPAPLLALPVEPAVDVELVLPEPAPAAVTAPAPAPPPPFPTAGPLPQVEETARWQWMGVTAEERIAHPVLPDAGDRTPGEGRLRTFLRGGILTTVVLAASALALRLTLAEPAGQPPAEDRPPQGLTRHVGPGHPFRSVAAALKASRTGDRVLVHADTVREYLWVNTPEARLLKGVTLESADPGRKVSWAPPAGPNKNTALAVLNDLDGVRIKGFAFDGEDRLEHLLVLTCCQGVTLEDVELRNFTGAGALFINCGGPSERAVELTRAHIDGDTRPPFLFEVRANFAGPHRNHVVVRDDCTFAARARARLVDLDGGENGGVVLPRGLRRETVLPDQK